MSAPPGTDAVAVVDERLGAAPALRRALRYVFPEQWSFLLGEIALYSFVVLLGTGVFLAPYAPLAGTQVTKAYDSTLGLSFEVPGGLLMRQVHHWAALVFLVAIVMHLLRVFFTGAFRRPRRLTWAIGVTLMAMAVLEGFAGYSLPDDLLSGMGLAIANGVALSLPIIGGDVGSAVWGGQFPGSGVIESRLYVLHILVLPLAMAGLIAAHLALIIRTHHTQSRGPGRRESNVVGAPLWPTYAVRSLGLLFATAAVLVLLGGLIQVNPVWEWGPYETGLSTNGAQPDWYLGWLIGALRLMPPVEPAIAGITPVPNPFWGGVLFPGVVFGLLYVYPWIESALTRDRREHHLIDRPRDRPWRTAFGAALFTWVALIFIAGSADRLFLQLGWSYEAQVHVFRALALLGPPIVFLLVKRACDDLRLAAAAPRA